MAKRNIVVIGASAGGVLALKKLVEALPATCQASIFVVQHLSAVGRSYLPEILSKAGPLPARHPIDEEEIAPGTIYVAPPDHHILLEDHRILVKRGPKENRFRPSIDALFRSAAYTFGGRVIGVVLTGLLNDGTSGMWSIKRHGGLGIIQEPEEAMYPSMPMSVLEYVEVDYVIPLAEIGSLLCQLTEEPAPEAPGVSPEEEQRTKKEIEIAAQDNGFEMGIVNFGTPTMLTCPECHGTLVSIKEGKFERFRCHTGHAFTANDLLAEITKTTEETMWSTIRAFEEAIMLLEKARETARQDDAPATTAQLDQKITELRDRIGVIRKIIFSQEPLSLSVERAKEAKKG